MIDMVPLVNRWIVEPNAREAAILTIDPAPIVYDGQDAEYKAYRAQERLVELGCSSQIYHERHVLMKESICWKPGAVHLRPEPEVTTSRDTCGQEDTIKPREPAG